MKKADMRELARITVEEVLGYREKLLKEEFDTRYRDVRLLMKNYRKLKAHYAHVSPETLEVGVICAMHRKTGLMMSHVDKMISLYEVLCRNPDDERRWQGLYLRYFCDERLTIEQIVERLAIDKRTFYRDMNKAMEDMAVLLFGIEAIGSWKHK